MIIRNITDGPKGIHIKGSSAILTLEPGQASGEVELADGESIDENGWFEVVADLDDDAPAKKASARTKKEAE